MRRFAPLAVTFAALWTGAALAQQPSAPQASSDPAGVVLADIATAKAKVAMVDRASRKVTLVGEDGRERTLIAGPEVRNFDQIEVGDTVTADYVDAIAVYVRAAGEPPSGATLSGVQVAPKGQKPGGTMMQQTEVTATIDDIDYAKRQVTLRDAEGKTRQVAVDERVQNLDRFKKGDEIVIRHTEALAIAVTK